MTKIKVKNWLLDSAKQLTPNSEFPFLETQVLLSFVLSKSREWLVSHPDEELSEDQVEQADQVLLRLKNGEPLPYITCKQAFFGLDFIVTPDVLIPRPETEHLVEDCIEWLEEHPQKRAMVDVGTGSGMIAITLADRFCDLKITAIDISEKALAIAQNNAELHHVDEQIRFLHGDLLDGCSQRFDLIAANLPYIPAKELATLAVAKYEPLLALDGGAEGLDLISKILTQCPDHIKPGGMIILEIESSQGEAVFKLASKVFPQAKISILDDLAQHPRILKILV